RLPDDVYVLLLPQLADLPVGETPYRRLPVEESPDRRFRYTELLLQLTQRRSPLLDPYPTSQPLADVAHLLEYPQHQFTTGVVMINSLPSGSSQPRCSARRSPTLISC